MYIYTSFYLLILIYDNDNYFILKLKKKLN